MRLIDGDYLYNKLVANKCPYDLVLQMVKDEPTVCDIDAIRQEIEQNAYPIVHGVNNHEKGMTLYGILQIIDRHTKGVQE